MSLAAGARLGPYEIVAPLGAGGMGEVYRAKDGRLNRTVAIKILSDESAADTDRRERFEREAKAISALDHPNICALYDVGEHAGVYFLGDVRDGHPPTFNVPPTFLIQTPFDEYDGRFSPDGRWVVYVSDESGRPEVYVQTFPLTGNKWMISTNGGAEPRWRADGRELFYLARDGKVMAVAVNGGSVFEVAAPKVLFQTAIRPVNNPFHVSMDASADGQRFLLKVPTESTESASGLTVVQNWPALTRGSR